ncbi:MAG TPA: serine hydrolase, partial [Planctomycetota bacterium]|nr:serine hydrolase [Planctomycetota bacterium]
MEWLDGGPPPTPIDLARNTASYETLLTDNGLSLDMAGGTVAVRGAALHDSISLGYPVEYLVVTDRGRTHEALFVIKARPSLLDACLRALDLTPGASMHYRLKENQPPAEDIASGKASPWDAVPATGPLVAIDVAWTDDAGLPQRRSMESLLVDTRNGTALPENDWVYTGSRFGTLRQGRQDVQAFVADMQGDVVAIYLTGQGAALFERNSLEGVDDTLYSLNSATMPKRGTPVTLLFSRTGRATPPPPSRASAPVVAGEMGAAMDAFLERLVPWGFSGVVAVQRGQQLLLHKGYGLANRRTGLAMDTAAVFPLSSLGKQFTAALILRLQADGKLGLEDPLSKFLPRAPADKAGITLRQLLQHTSGLPQEAMPPIGATDRDAALAGTLATPLVAKPGEEFHYSNIGYTLLAAVAEEAAESGFPVLLSEAAFGPAAMIDCGLSGESAWDDSQLVHGYQDGADEVAAALQNEGPRGLLLGRDVGNPAKSAFPWNQLGAGAVACTVRDLLRWENALRDGKILPPAQLATMLAPGLDDYGCAWWIQSSAHGALAWHDGIVPGFRLEVRRYLDEDVTVIVAANAEINGVASPVSALAFGEELPLPPEVVPTLSTAKLSPPEGTPSEGTLPDPARDAAREARALDGAWSAAAGGPPLFRLRALEGDLYLGALSDEVYATLGPALGFSGATLKDRMSRRGGLRFRPVRGQLADGSPAPAWAAFESFSCGT